MCNLLKLIWDSVRKQSSLNLSIFFLFCFVEMFQSSLNCESSLKFFSAEFSVEFSFIWLTCRISVVDFRWILLLFFGSFLLVRAYRQLTHLLANFPTFSSIPNSCWGFNGSCRQKKKKKKSLFGAALSGITFPFSTPAKPSAARGRPDLFLRNNFL